MIVTGQSERLVVVQSLSRVQLFVTPWTAAPQAPLSFTISQSLPKFMSIESVMLSNSLILCCSLPLLPSIFPIIWVFTSESSLRIKWPKCWRFNNSPSRENSDIHWILGGQIITWAPSTLVGVSESPTYRHIVSFLYLLLPTILTILNLERSKGQFNFSEFPPSAFGILESQNPILFSHVSGVFASSVSVLWTAWKSVPYLDFSSAISQ